MRVVVTGASGFLGQELIKQLSERDIDFVAATTHPSLLAEVSGISASSVVEAKQLLHEEFYEEDDVVMNCAFPRTNDGAAMADGLNFLAKLIKNATNSKAAGFINISSQSVYSQHRTKPATEADPLCLESPYAVAKRGVELLLDTQDGRVPYTNIRLASLIGPNFDQRVPNRMAKRALETGQIQVADNGSQFGFMDVRDAANALIKMLESPSEKWRYVYNLSSQECWTLSSLALMVKDAVESISGKVVSIYASVNESLTMPLNTLLNASLFQKDFCWSAKFEQRDSVETIVAQTV